LNTILSQHGNDCGRLAQVRLARAARSRRGSFLTLLGRILSERNRMRAAERTVAWIATHHREGLAMAKKGEIFPSANDAKFALLLRDLHFRGHGRSAGIVRVSDHSRWDSGIFCDGDGGFEYLVETDRSIAEYGGNNPEANIQDPGNNPGLKEKIDDKDGKSVGDYIEGALSGAMEAFLAFIAGDFYHYRARVDYAMPLLFPRGAYEMFWGAMDGVESADPVVIAQLEPHQKRQRTFAWLKGHDAAGCVFPLIDSGGDGALADIKNDLGNLLDKAQKAMEEAEKPYRPHVLVEGEKADPDVAHQLEGLMYYEAFDIRQEYAGRGRNDYEVSTNWAAKCD